MPAPASTPCRICAAWRRTVRSISIRAARVPSARSRRKARRSTSDLDFVLYLLDKGGVASVHGAAYGLSPYFRLSTATSMEMIKQACDRIEKACADLR